MLFLGELYLGFQSGTCINTELNILLTLRVEYVQISSLEVKLYNMKLGSRLSWGQEIKSNNCF